MSVSVAVERYLPKPGHAPALRDVVVTASADGLAVTASSVAGPGLLALPAPVNAHDHGYGIRPFDFGGLDDALEPWIPFMRLRPPTDPHLEALVALCRIAKSGCGATMHCHNSLNVATLVDEAGQVVRAAHDVGIRLGLSCPLLDDSPFVYGGLPQLLPGLSATDRARVESLAPTYAPIAEQLAAVDAIAKAHGSDMVDVQFGPIGPQWASHALLEAIADASARTGRRIHMHLLESPRQRAWLDQRFPQGVVRFLDDIGFLSPRLAVAHGVQLRPDECELLAERGVVLASNPSANLRLRSGVAPLEAIHAAGLSYAIGLDGTGFDDDQDIWREMRLFHLLHGGRGLEPAIPMAEIFDAAILRGAAVVNQAPARDLVVVDYAALVEDAMFDDLDESQMLLGRMTAGHVRGLVVGGRAIIEDGRLTSVDFESARRELVAQARAAAPNLKHQRDNAHFLSEVVRRHYAGYSG